MAFGVLHLSDIHFRENETEIQERASAVRAAVQSRCTGLSSIIVVFSGDLVYSGKQSQYNIASVFIDHLMGQLRTILGVEVMGPVIVPGNHDCDFETEGDVRPQLLAALPNRLENLDPEGQTCSK
jgi:predicted MPP superfamily phosphohydrolase